ncbi:uncharacterized protein LOC129606525 [Condylostylus longicornis]|uniref:uncharacterized protein LOC129606525 n=1 Tax=Condylostylus longicornis TaxID=2530218 RepID=UPI00244E319D|nr:uncharacterized protein LOC129606525 [Condylostylus longicornis]
MLNMENMHHTVEGEASESDDEQKNGFMFSRNYGIAVDGEASESENEDKNLIEYDKRKDKSKDKAEKEQLFFKGILSDKIWLILTEFKYLVWDNIKKNIEHNLIFSTKKVREADKMLLKSQMALQIVSNNLENSKKNVLKIIEVTQMLESTNYLPSLNIRERM